MTDDIVTRLRIACRQEGAEYCGKCQPCQAADEIERLRTELNLARRAYDMAIFGESDIDENGVVRGV